MTEHLGLREQKKRRTRQSLVAAALRLFAEQGYEHTTVAEIAAAAQVSYATFFNYFTAKDNVVFADDDLYDDLLAEAFAAADPTETPAEFLVRTIEHLATAPAWSFPLDHELTLVRARLIAEVPALRAGDLLRNATRRQQLAHALQRAHPDLDDLHAAALTGALVGGVDAVLHSPAMTSVAPQDIPTLVGRAARIALAGHLPPEPA